MPNQLRTLSWLENHRGPYLDLAKQVEQSIQTHAHDLAEWCKKLRLEVHAFKCETMLYRKEDKHSYNHTLAGKFNGEEIKQVKTAKYLGVTLDLKLSWSAHLEGTVRKAVALMAQLYPLLIPKSKINPKRAIRIYKATIFFIITYACPVWRGAQIKANIQNKTLRSITRVLRENRITMVHENLKIPMVNEIISKLNENFYNECRDHDNLLISRFANAAPT
ncbi:hypothetical protein B566_EDAN017809 [Ephemera danica]|nr:hypothetical protein B566_EDAN017809 [Ephemera danica]